MKALPVMTLHLHIGMTHLSLSLHLALSSRSELPVYAGAFAQATEFVQSAVAANGKVLVHCKMGQNRSATVAMAVQMNIEQLTLDEAYIYTHSCRSVANPFSGNKAKIAVWEEATRGECTIPEWLPAPEPATEPDQKEQVVEKDGPCVLA